MEATDWAALVLALVAEPTLALLGLRAFRQSGNQAQRAARHSRAAGIVAIGAGGFCLLMGVLPVFDAISGTAGIVGVLAGLVVGLTGATIWLSLAARAARA